MLSPIELFLTCVSTDPHPTESARRAERGAVVAVAPANRASAVARVSRHSAAYCRRKHVKQEGNRTD